MTSRRRLAVDRAARWLITAGGLGIVASILAILVFILVEVAPLASSARVEPHPGLILDALRPAAVVVDEHRTHAVTLGGDGRVVAVRMADGARVFEREIAPARSVAATPDGRALTLATGDGRVVILPARFEVSFDGRARRVAPEVPEPIVLLLDPEGRPLGAHAARLGDDGTAAAGSQLADGSLAVVQRTSRENLLSGEVEVSIERQVAEVPGRLTSLVMDGDRRALYGSLEDGDLVWWPLEAGRPGPPQRVPLGGSPATALALLIGDRSLVVGQADGSIAVFMPVRRDGQAVTLARVRGFPAHPGAIRLLAPSRRDKGFLAQDETGLLGLYYSTSERVMWRGVSPLPAATALAYAPKADGAVLAGDGRLVPIEVRNPHPEAGFKAFFGKVWYEGRTEPEHVWQSSGGTDDFEPKLSLTPLVIGTLKGTIFSLLLAIPLGVFAAMYASQFMHPDLLRYVKPTVEIMAALPSVVLGFLAGLWLAPRVERVFPALLLMVVVLPAAVLLAGWSWRRLPQATRGSFPAGAEVALHLAALVVGIAACLALNRPLADGVFGGSFPAWLLESTGTRYDQRNAVVVGLAMGFAVVPIIFAIAEDAFTNVPKSLISGSLALGANRWQTVTRVVLPTASPGIFSAIMVGFGRAVGETMIVLMATGNTPIMDWSPFNGFRTLSANIAVEIPEAPHGSTLYRTLFLAALLLFVVTFAVNTVAEIVRQRLRRRFAGL